MSEHTPCSSCCHNQTAEHHTLPILLLSAAALTAGFALGGRLPFDPSWIALALCGIPILKQALNSLLREKRIEVSLLVSTALAASIAIGEIFAAGEVAFIMTLGEYLEARTLKKARAGLERLIRLTPATARRITGGQTETISAEDVAVGDRLRVLPGDTVPVDGVLTAGESFIDQSTLTGESLPAEKHPGDTVYGGSINQFGAFEMTARKIGSESAIQRIITLVASADASKAKSTRLARRWASWLVGAAILTALGVWSLTGETIRAVTVLVVFCPCALVLATPTAVTAGIGNATRRGILIRDGSALERLAPIRHIVFDKTGTLTRGAPTVAQIIPIRATPQDLLRLAATAELHSEHPLGQAILRHYTQTAGAQPPPPATFTLAPGLGVIATTPEGDTLHAGSPRFLAQHGIPIAPEGITPGANPICIARNGHAIGIITLADTSRPEARAVLETLRAQGIEPSLLTGDSPEAAARIAGSLGIEILQAASLPADKKTAIDTLQATRGPACMIGDGINDAPALKAAAVGIAMGGIGSAIAIDAADIALVGDDLTALPHLTALSRRTSATIRFNILASILLNFLAIGLAATGILTPVTGALLHNAGSIAVVLNAIRLRTWKPAPHAPA